MKREDVKQWNCSNGLAVAVNPFPEKITYSTLRQKKSYFHKQFNVWASDPANQPVTDLSGIYNSDEVREVWEFSLSNSNIWMLVLPYAYKNCDNNYTVYSELANKQFFDTRRRLVPAEAALCNTDSSVKEDKPITDISKLQAQFDNQMKHKESIKQYWLSCSESKNKWVEAIKEYFDGGHNEISTFEDFKYQFDLD